MSRSRLWTLAPTRARPTALLGAIAGGRPMIGVGSRAKDRQGVVERGAPLASIGSGNRRDSPAERTAQR